MASTNKLKQSLYFPDDTLREMMQHANRLDRSLSWTVQQAWKLAREEIRKFPSVRAGADGTSRLPPPPRERPAAAASRNDDWDREPSAQVREFLKGKFDHELAG
jgi:uncharacterized small protein (TIGR04563 family)